MNALFVVHPLRVILFEREELGISPLVVVEEIIEDVFFVLVDFSVEEHRSIASFAQVFDELITAVE